MAPTLSQHEYNMLLKPPVALPGEPARTLAASYRSECMLMHLPRWALYTVKGLEKSDILTPTHFGYNKQLSANGLPI